MGKKNLTKSQRQKGLLETYYQKSDGCWSREQLNRIADDLGLTRQQVYKWLWDKRNFEKKKTNTYVKIEEGQLNYDSDSDREMHEFVHNKCTIKVPDNLRRAVQFIVDPGVSIWTRSLLRHEGWQLIKYAQRKTHNVHIDQYLSGDGMPKSKEQEMFIKQIESPQNVIKSSRYDLVNDQFEDHQPFSFFKGKFSSNKIKEEVIDQPDSKISHYFSKKDNRLHFLPEFPQTIKKKPAFRADQKGSSDQIFESNS